MIPKIVPTPLHVAKVRIYGEEPMHKSDVVRPTNKRFVRTDLTSFSGCHASRLRQRTDGTLQFRLVEPLTRSDDLQVMPRRIQIRRTCHCRNRKWRDRIAKHEGDLQVTMIAIQDFRLRDFNFPDFFFDDFFLFDFFFDDIFLDGFFVAVAIFLVFLPASFFLALFLALFLVGFFLLGFFSRCSDSSSSSHDSMTRVEPSSVPSHSTFKPTKSSRTVSLNGFPPARRSRYSSSLVTRNTASW